MAWRRRIAHQIQNHTRRLRTRDAGLHRGHSSQSALHRHATRQVGRARQTPSPRFAARFVFTPEIRNHPPEIKPARSIRNLKRQAILPQRFPLLPPRVVNRILRVIRRRFRVRELDDVHSAEIGNLVPFRLQPDILDPRNLRGHILDSRERLFLIVQRSCRAKLIRHHMDHRLGLPVVVHDRRRSRRMPGHHASRKYSSHKQSHPSNHHHRAPLHRSHKFLHSQIRSQSKRPAPLRQLHVHRPPRRPSNLTKPRPPFTLIRTGGIECPFVGRARSSSSLPSSLRSHLGLRHHRSRKRAKSSSN